MLYVWLKLTNSLDNYSLKIESRVVFNIASINSVFIWLNNVLATLNKLRNYITLYYIHFDLFERDWPIGLVLRILKDEEVLVVVAAVAAVAVVAVVDE